MVEIEKQVEVMLAYGDKLIQIRARHRDDIWDDDSGIRPLCFNWCDYEYRIKPEPREFTVMVMGDGDLRSMSDQSAGYNGEVIKVREVLD